MITCFGEVLVDMLAGRIHLGDSGADDCYYPVAGGAPANVAVAVARLGGESRFVGGVSRDRFGGFLLDELVRCGVDTRSIWVSDRPTALAIVSIDDAGERSFSFYGDNAAHLDFPATAIPSGGANEIRHFSSNTLTQSPVRAATSDFIGDGVASFDINFRPGLWKEPDKAADIIEAFATRSAIVKTSLEELTALYPDSEVDAVIEGWLDVDSKVVVVTDGKNPIRVLTREGNQVFDPPEVDAVDTTAAGDAFVGGFLYSIANAGAFDRWSSNAEQILYSARFAACCGALAVTRPGAFPSLPTRTAVDDFQSKLESS